MKQKVFLVVIVMMAMLLPQRVMAYDFSAVSPSGHTLYYSLLSGGVSVVSQNTSSPYYSTYPTGNLVIPSSVTHHGYTYNVTSIGNEAFSGCSGLTSVNIPNSVSSIGDGAFYGCSGLTSVSIPNSVSSIGDAVFSDCSGLTSVTVVAGNTHYDSRNNCNAIIETSNNRLIAGCQTTVIPNSVTSIGNYAFYGCNGLTSVTIPNSVISIGDGAFYNCNTLIIVNFNATNCTTMGIDFLYILPVFGGCTALSTIIFGENVSTVPDGAFYGCSGLISVTIPDSVTSIGNSAFSGCSGLTTVNFNATNCTTMGSPSSPVFNGCTNLATLNIGENVTRIPSYAFKNCSGLTTVNFNATNCTTMNYPVFENCTNLTMLNIGENVTQIPNYSFVGCSGLTSVNIPNSVSSIGDGAFYGCSGLTSVSIPNSVSSIGDAVFSDCSGLTSVTVVAGNTHYDSRNNCNAIIETSNNRLIAGCQTTVIPNSVSSIGNNAFYGCSGLTSVTIPSSVTSIGNSAFSGCSGLTSVTIPNSVTSIGDYAFNSCSGLMEITSFALTAPTLGSNAFNGVSTTIPVYIPCGSLASYQTTWSSFSNFLEPPAPYTINVGVADSAFGASYITEVPACDSTAVIEATANYGYHFTQWSDGNTDNPRTITLTQDTNLIAYFGRNEYQLTLNSANPTLGTVTGSGTYLYLDTAHIVANATEHHHLVHWSDGDRNATRDIVITADMELTATFAIDTHTVTLTVNDITRGMVETTGTEFVYGTPCTVTATAYTGYTFHSWSNGVTANPYTFAVVSDVELTAIFLSPGEQTYTVTVSSANPAMGSATVNGNATATVMSGETVTLAATANAGYRFLRWNDNNTDSVRTVAVTADITYTAYFESTTTQGIGEVGGQRSEVRVYAVEGKIVVSGAEGMEMRVFDMVGREVVASTRSHETPMLPNGVYLVKVGTLPARKVVVLK